MTYEWSQIHYGNGDAVHNTFGAHVNAGEVHLYDTRYQLGGCSAYGSTYNCLYNVIDHNILSSTAFDPVGYWSDPWSMQFAEESLFYGSNVPGTASAQALVANMQYIDGSFQAHAAGCDILVYENDDSSHWGHSPQTCSTQGFYTSVSY